MPVDGRLLLFGSKLRITSDFFSLPFCLPGFLAHGLTTILLIFSIFFEGLLAMGANILIHDNFAFSIMLILPAIQKEIGSVEKTKELNGPKRKEF